MTQKKLKEYKGFIWTRDLTRPGLRVSVMATDPEEAFDMLEEKHGKGTVHDLHNEEDANTIR
ncbi:hypothetical protein LXT21_12545 [Myxococcus sp. K38C18041901]|uniref:hypothetical protein n=1 Tax=Myxococcus guangdongensis TaxID=2906760 RepID=UPI0020A7BA80|nr:hypothetical protein [Myxococcus guangdongensis]MCP3059607.1 hypothetical protein [Myxococcus guangdongensis]